MEHNEDRDSLRDIPTFTLPPPPRFDAAASAAARPVEPLPNGILARVYGKTRVLPRRVRLLVLVAIVGLTTGAVGGMLVIVNDAQQPLSNASPLNSLGSEQDTNFDVPEAAIETSPEQPEVTPTAVTPRPPRRHTRLQNRARPAVVFADDDEEDEDRSRKIDDDDDRRKSDRKPASDDERAEKSGRGAVLYDVLRSRKP